MSAVIRKTSTWNMTHTFYSTWEKPVCCVISSDSGCQSNEIGVAMEVRLLSVGTRGFFFARRFATRLRGFAPNEKKKPLVPGYMLLSTWMKFSWLHLVVSLRQKLFEFPSAVFSEPLASFFDSGIIETTNLFFSGRRLLSIVYEIKLVIVSTVH